MATHQSTVSPMKAKMPAGKRFELFLRHQRRLNSLSCNHVTDPRATIKVHRASCCTLGPHDLTYVKHQSTCVSKDSQIVRNSHTTRYEQLYELNPNWKKKITTCNKPKKHCEN